MRKLSKFIVQHIRLEPHKGVDIGSCIREAQILALEEWANVKFTFNEKEYSVYVNDLIAQVRKEND